MAQKIRLTARIVLLALSLLATTAVAQATAGESHSLLTSHTAFTVVAIIAIAIQSFLLFLAFFEPVLRYKVATVAPIAIESSDFLRVIEAVTDAKLYERTQVAVLTNGEAYYPAELDAIRAAEKNVCLEAYIFRRGRVAHEFVEILALKAREGVRVNLLMDAVGSFRTFRPYFHDLLAAGGRVAWYHPFTWHGLGRINNRTHRELLTVDGRVGFIGGAGVADHWLYPSRRARRWRDTMARVDGDAVASLQATFVENWLEATGEILTGLDYFPNVAAKPGVRAALVVNSTPSAGRSTPARILFQMLLAGAQRSLLITTPYFVPDRSARVEMVRAITERGVQLIILVPGPHTDLRLVRRSGRRMYGQLLLAGAKIYEYRPGMIHTKSLVVDGLWSVVGSTNFDHRSFGLNDEVNLAVLDEALAARLAEDFAHDLAESRAITYEHWRRRMIFERVQEWLGWLLERQQ